MKNRIHYSRYTDPDPVADDYVSREEEEILSNSRLMNELAFYSGSELDFYSLLQHMVQRTDDEYVLRHMTQILKGTHDRSGDLDALLTTLYVENNALYQMAYSNYDARTLMDSNRFLNEDYVYNYMMDLSEGVGPVMENVDPLNISKLLRFHDVRFNFDVDFLNMYVLSYFYGDAHEVSVARAVTW